MLAGTELDSGHAVETTAFLSKEKSYCTTENEIIAELTAHHSG